MKTLRFGRKEVYILNRDEIVDVLLSRSMMKAAINRLKYDKESRGFETVFSEDWIEDAVAHLDSALGLEAG